MATPIQWVQNPDGSPGETWNPTRGCSLESPGCTNCYAMRTAWRFNGPGLAYEGLTRRRVSLGPVWTGELREIVEKLGEPLGWSKPTDCFVNSMSDLFHPGVSDRFIAAIFGVMAACPLVTFKILTKRSARMRAWVEAFRTAEWGGSVRRLGEVAVEVGGFTGRQRKRLLNLPTDRWPLENVIGGVSVEAQKWADLRVVDLLQTDFARRMLSLEPQLDDVQLWALGDGSWHDAEGADRYDALRGFSWWGDGGRGIGGGPRLDWVVLGGESGPGARAFDVAWARHTAASCLDAKVALFVKQWGAKPYDSARPGHVIALRDDHGGDMEEWDVEELRVRQPCPPLVRLAA